jgi:hypothetical protein
LKGLDLAGYETFPSDLKDGVTADVIDLEGNQHVCVYAGDKYGAWLKVVDGFQVNAMCVKVHV